MNGATSVVNVTHTYCAIASRWDIWGMFNDLLTFGIIVMTNKNHIGLLQD